MNRSTNLSPSRAITRIAVLFCVVITTLLSAYGQQEVDPAWYDPWVAPNAVVVHAPKPREVMRRQQSRATFVAPPRRAAPEQQSTGGPPSESAQETAGIPYPERRPQSLLDGLANGQNTAATKPPAQAGFSTSVATPAVARRESRQ